MEAHHIGFEPLTVQQIYTIVKNRQPLILSDEAEKAIQKCRDYLDVALPQRSQPVYGVNTGFGSLCKVRVPDAELEQLQRNLILSHASGTGGVLDTLLIRILLFLKIRSLAFGHSGVRLLTVQRLIDMYNADVLPVIYEQGSLGASGDLCPLAHMSLPLLGEGNVLVDGVQQSAAEVLASKGWESLRLASKEGLALLNGTQFMAAHAVMALAEAERMLHAANITASL